MGEGEVVVALVAMTGGFAFLFAILATIRAIVLRGASAAASNQVLHELRALREEVAQLRQQNMDVILSFDSGISRLTGRLDRVEERTLPAPQAEQEQTHTVGLLR